MPNETLLFMALALGAGGFVKGATGMGLPLIAIPVLATWMGVPSAVALMSVPTLLTNGWQVWRFRADAWTLDFLPLFLAAGAVGIGLGTLLIVSVPERALSLTLAVLLFVYVGLRLARPAFTIGQREGRRAAPAAGVAAGLLQGATGISAPIGVTFIHALRLHRTAHLFAVSAMFLLFSLVQLPALAIAGVLTWRLLLLSVLAILPVVLMMPVGTWLASRWSQTTFDRAILLLLALVGLQLVVRSIG